MITNTQRVIQKYCHDIATQIVRRVYLVLLNSVILPSTSSFTNKLVGAGGGVDCFQTRRPLTFPCHFCQHSGLYFLNSTEQTTKANKKQHSASEYPFKEFI